LLVNKEIMKRQELISNIFKKQSFLCVGLDPILDLFPPHILQHDDSIFEFNKQIIDATLPYAVAYKPNTAFYEAHGIKGWEALEKTIRYIPKECFIIADAKRGDIGNTSKAYAKTFFETMSCDAITVAPYMGKDSVVPFLEFENKWAIVLALTSNEGANDFQSKTDEFGIPLYKKVISTVKEWGSCNNLMFVAGATRAHQLREIRELIPNHFLLVPGVGAQGGELSEVIDAAATLECGLLVNASRSIIYASNGEDFADAAKNEALKIKTEMQSYFQRLKT